MSGSISSPWISSLLAINMNETRQSRHAAHELAPSNDVDIREYLDS